MEKLFFTITRWLMLIGATVAFVILIGGGIYALNLYKISQDTDVNKSPYDTKEPKVSFNDYKRIKEELLNKEKLEKMKIEKYVLSIILNGSEGHGYPMGSMPPGMAQGQDAKDIAKYVSNKLFGDQPAVFAACSACHGIDGAGNDGMSPSLIELPIYNGLVAKEIEKTSYAPSESNSETTKYEDPLKEYSAKIVSDINRYAILVNQEGTTVDNVYNYFNELSKKYDTETFSTLKEQFSNELKSLLEYGKTFKESNKDANEALRWIDFIDWFINDFNAQLDLEKEKHNDSLSKIEQMKNEKENKALNAKVELLQTLIGVGTALIIFILLTMILVLFKIETNTRKNDSMIEE